MTHRFRECMGVIQLIALDKQYTICFFVLNIFLEGVIGYNCKYIIKLDSYNQKNYDENNENWEKRL